MFEALDVKPWPDRRDTIVEPDILVVCDPEKITERRIEGAPDFVIEIASPGNYQNDYLRKLEIYSKCGVREYWIINPMKRNVLVYIFENGEIAPAMYTFDDSIPVSITTSDYLVRVSASPTEGGSVTGGGSVRAGTSTA